MRSRTFGKFLIVFLVPLGLCFASPPPVAQQLRYLHENVAELRRNVANGQREIELLLGKCSVQDELIDGLCHEQTSLQRQIVEALKERDSAFNEKFISVDLLLPQLKAEVLLLKEQLAQSVQAENSFRAKIASCEELIAHQAKALQHLQQAMQALTAAFPSDGGGDGMNYTVQEGDSLGKIAKRHGVTVKALKEVNGLTTDKIRVGQSLTLPSS